MGFNVTFTVDDKEVRRAFRAAPSVMIKHIERQQARGGHELAREMKIRAPKAFSTLANSIHSARAGELHYVVAPGVKYAPFVEGGSRPGGAPSLGAMIRWLRVKRISSARYPEERDLARAIIHKIRQRGTPAQPFAEPAADAKASRLIALMEQGVASGLREAFG